MIFHSIGKGYNVAPSQEFWWTVGHMVLIVVQHFLYPGDAVIYQYSISVCFSK